MARAFELAAPQRSVVLLLAKGSDATQHMATGFVPCATDSELAAAGVAAYDRTHAV